MQINQRLYPHPVLAWFNDDYPKGIFQPAFQPVANKSFFKLVLVCKTSSRSINSLIAEKKAAYCIHVECSSTRFRSAYTSFEENFEVDIPVGDLDGKVEVSRTIVATQSVSNYSSEEFHTDFSGRSFDLSPGDVIAVAETVEFPALKKDDELAKLPSIFAIVADKSNDVDDIDIDLNDQKLRIILSSELHRKFLDLNGDPTMRATLSQMLLIPALISALEHIRNIDDKGALFDRRWFNVLNRRMSELGIDAGQLSNCPDSSLTIANKLLNRPLSQSFDDLESLLVQIGDE